MKKLPKECNSNKGIESSLKFLNRRHHLKDTTMITFVKKTYYHLRVGQFFNQNSIITISKNSVKTVDKQNVTILEILCSIQNL